MSTSTETAAAQTAAGTEPVLRAAQVTLRFGGLTSLGDVSLELRRGEILAVIGPNGAGKTSLFNCLTGVYLPQEGTIEFQAEPGGAWLSLRGRKPHLVNRAGVSRTFQNIRLFNALTVLENVQIAAETRVSSGPVGVMLGLPRNNKAARAARHRSREMLEFVGLRGKENLIASGLSYGDQRRLEIARALASDPKVLLLDEPAAGTNPSEKLGLAQLIQRINTELGISILLIEHDMRLVMSVASRITVLNFGKVIASGSPAEVQQNPAVVEAYLGSEAAAEATEAGEESPAAFEAIPEVPAASDVVPAARAAEDADEATDAEAEADAGEVTQEAEEAREAEATEATEATDAAQATAEAADADADADEAEEATGDPDTPAAPEASADGDTGAGTEGDTGTEGEADAGDDHASEEGSK